MRADGSASLPSGLAATFEIVSALDRCARNKAWNTAVGPADLTHRWTSEALHRRGAGFGLECLAWCRALPTLSALLAASEWWHLFEILLSAAENSTSPADGNVDLLSRQWLAAELPLTMAYLFPEIAQTRRLAHDGARSVFADSEPAIAADGMPSARTMTHVRSLLATWTRSRAIARRLKKSRWDDAAEARYAAFARQVVRLTRRDGTTMLSTDRPEPADRELFAAAFAGADRADRALARLVLPGHAGPQNMSAKSLPAPAANNETAGVTLLRPNWSRSRERLVVARHGSQLRTELACGRDVLWSGIWTCEVRRDGVPLVPEPDAAWEEVCWTSNEDADYLELELALPNNIRVQRQMVLAREDRFLFLADAVLGEQSAALEYRSVLPLTAETTFDAATESREGYLVGRKARALVFPLALPEWRAAPCQRCARVDRRRTGAAAGRYWVAPVCAFVSRLGSAAPGAAGNLAATDRRRNTPGGAGGFGRGLPRAGPQQAMARLPIAWRAQQPHRARPESRLGVSRGAIQHQRRDRAAGRDRGVSGQARLAVRCIPRTTPWLMHAESPKTSPLCASVWPPPPRAAADRQRRSL